MQERKGNVQHPVRVLIHVVTTADNLIVTARSCAWTGDNQRLVYLATWFHLSLEDILFYR